VALKLIFTQESLRDLESIAGYIAFDSEKAAARFVASLIDYAEVLSSFPHLGVNFDQRSDIRMLLHTPIRIYYRVDYRREAIEILHFWHTSRRDPAI